MGFTENVLNNAISQTQDLMVSMSQGCSGGPNGVLPVNWTQLQAHGNSAVNALNAVRIALAKGQTSNLVQQINSAQGELDALVNGAHDNCSGGAHGVDPVYYGRYQAVRAAVRAKLDAVRELLPEGL
jgi:hypothetical protein